MPTVLEILSQATQEVYDLHPSPPMLYDDKLAPEGEQIASAPERDRQRNREFAI